VKLGRICGGNRIHRDVLYTRLFPGVWSSKLSLIPSPTPVVVESFVLLVTLYSIMMSGSTECLLGWGRSYWKFRFRRTPEMNSGRSFDNIVG